MVAELHMQAGRGKAAVYTAQAGTAAAAAALADKQGQVAEQRIMAQWCMRFV